MSERSALRELATGSFAIVRILAIYTLVRVLLRTGFDHVAIHALGEYGWKSGPRFAADMALDSLLIGAACHAAVLGIGLSIAYRWRADAIRGAPLAGAGRGRRALRGILLPGDPAGRGSAGRAATPSCS